MKRIRLDDEAYRLLMEAGIHTSESFIMVVKRQLGPVVRSAKVPAHGPSCRTIDELQGIRVGGERLDPRLRALLFHTNKLD